jgi:hypothetical protein
MIFTFGAVTLILLGFNGYAIYGLKHDVKKIVMQEIKKLDIKFSESNT